jgi:hypothetical protein
MILVFLKRTTQRRQNLGRNKNNNVLSLKEKSNFDYSNCLELYYSMNL